MAAAPIAVRDPVVEVDQTVTDGCATIVMSIGPGTRRANPAMRTPGRRDDGRGTATPMSDHDQREATRPA